MASAKDNKLPETAATDHTDVHTRNMLLMEPTVMKLKTLLLNTLQTAVIVIAVMTAADWWRKPSQPAGQTLPELSGSLASEHLNQKPLAVVYFWGSWCGICRYTSPAIDKLHQDGVPVIGVALQSGTDAQVSAYLREHDWSFASLNDPDGRLARQWQVVATPTIVILKNGKMVHHTVGISSYWGLRLRLWWTQTFA